MQSLTDIRTLLAERGLAPRKSLGQNFLIDHNLINRLVDAAGISAGDRILEVGPGTGTLTEALLERGAQVIACELDRGLAQLLRDRLGDRPGFRLIEGDCLAGRTTLNPAITEALGDGPFRLVANLPYGAASPLMVILAGMSACTGQFVTIQKEVAQRLRARPSTKDYGELTIIIQALCTVERIATLPPECFWPRPKVHSEMVAITPRPDPLTTNPARLTALTRRLFSARRKQIASTLGRDTKLPEGIDPKARPDALTPEQLCALAESLQH